jgi:3-oxoacyl-[acyl-carrier-protein] synthase-3
MIESGRARTVLAIGADLLTRYLDRDDPSSAMLFGDGAGAVLLTATAGASQVGPAVLSSDGSRRELIRLARDELLIRMDGATVYRHAVQLMSDVTGQVVGGAGLTLADIDLFVYHQANSRIIDAVGQRLHLDPARVVDVVGSFANTSAASLPIAMDGCTAATGSCSPRSGRASCGAGSWSPGAPPTEPRPAAQPLSPGPLSRPAAAGQPVSRMRS